MIICGDFNCRMNNDQDNCLRQLKNIINKLNLLGAWIFKYPDHKGLSWCSTSDVPIGRIDFVFVSYFFVIYEQI